MMTFNNRESELTLLLENSIKSFCSSMDENSFGRDSEERLWDEPIIGYSRGDDPLFNKIKKDIGQFYWTPIEIFTKTFPKVKVSPEKLTVITWILPQTKATKADHQKETE